MVIKIDFTPLTSLTLQTAKSFPRKRVLKNKSPSACMSISCSSDYYTKAKPTHDVI